MSRWMDDLCLRASVYPKLVDWSATEVHDHLAKLLGYVDWDCMVNGFNDQDRHTCRMLNGSNGYCVYKMLLVSKR